jgi:hypothetical protein
MSERISMVRLLHGLLYPTVARCQLESCYLGRTLAGIRFETGTWMSFRTADDFSHLMRSKLPEDRQRADLVKMLQADGRNVVRFDSVGRLVVGPKDGED